MDPLDLRRRSDIARLLRAGRWLAGALQPAQERVQERSATTHTPVGWKVAALSLAELAAREPLASNWWTANKIGRVERMEAEAAPQELDMLERALGLPGLFDDVSGPRSAADPPTSLTRPVQGHAPSAVRLPRPSSLPAAAPESDGQ